MRPRLECGPERGAATTRLVFGILLMALGAIFLGDNLGYFDARDAFRLFWPLAFVVAGVAILFGSFSRGASRYWGLVWIVAGVWIWAYQSEWIAVDFWDFFIPGLLVVLGVSLVWRSFTSRSSRPRNGDDPDAELKTFAVMSGNEVRSTSKGFRSADLGAVMGGVKLDLTRAGLVDGEAEIDVFAMWGAIEIRVPRDWSVSSKVVPLMAGYEDKTEPLASGEAVKGRLVIRGFVVMGGIEVTN